MYRALLFLAALFCLLNPATRSYAQDPSQQPADQAQTQPSLADIARQTRKDKERNAAKPKTVVTDDNLPSRSGLGGLSVADLGDSQASGSGDPMAKAAARLQEAQAGLDKLDKMDRVTLAKTVLLDHDVDFPNRRNWEDKLYAGKERYVSHERELVTELKQIMDQVHSMSSQGASKLDPNDPHAQQLKNRLMDIIQDAIRTEQVYRAVVMEGWDLAKQGKP